MKNMISKTGSVTRMMLVMVLVGFFTMSDAWAKVFTVSLSLENNQTELKIPSRGSCNDKNHNGCIRVDKGKNADINFNLSGDKKCNKEADSTWELTAVFLGGEGSLTKPSSWCDLRIKLCT